MALPDLNDTIVALSSAPGPGGRAVVRLSGPDALSVACTSFAADEPISPHQRQGHAGHVRLPDVSSPLPADLYLWPAPRTYTGQQLVEIHTLSSPPVIDLLITTLLGAGSRAAGPGEFTMRAFLSGKLDLTQAEAVLGVLEASRRDELKQSLAQLAGGVTRPLQALRSDLLDLLADVEAGLDFTEEDIHFVSPEELLKRLANAMAHLTVLGRQLRDRGVSEEAFRVVLAGRPNAGKSSLFNALSGGSALVSPVPGTTRDYLVHRLDLDGVMVELVDTAGVQQAGGAIESQAQSLGRAEIERADLLLVCIECGQTPDASEQAMLARPEALGVATKRDLCSGPTGWLAASAVSGEGLTELRAAIGERVREQRQPALAPSLSRCRHHVEGGIRHLRQAHSVVLFGEPPELLALELRGALDQLGEMVGAVYTDDLLDRIFSRFCIGK